MLILASQLLADNVPALPLNTAIKGSVQLVKRCLNIPVVSPPTNFRLHCFVALQLGQRRTRANVSSRQIAYASTSRATRCRNLNVHPGRRAGFSEDMA
ncbi:hypothetical protein BDZ89DRAFT_1066132 [Hymenopellis radicata]|nr:hypothetical protein BDZ89DRAFT_1066132 [Hymenopellis radicata]